MTEEEMKEVSNAMGWLESLLDDMEDNWDETEPVYEDDYLRWRETIIKAFDILLELRES